MSSIRVNSCCFVVAASTAMALGLAPALAGDVRIVTWNVKDIFSASDVAARASDLANMAAEIKPDILCLEEVTSLSVVEAIAKKMHLNDFHVACSDFAQSDAPNRNAFEVAIVSRYPFTQVIEYDPSLDNQEDEDDPEELKLTPPKKLGIEGSGGSRGCLWARIDDVKLTVAVVHLKSSLGNVGAPDAGNARKREYVVSAVAAGVNEDIAYFPGFSFIVLGDFNVGHSDTKKNGISVAADCHQNCGANEDRYDETHALLGAGLVGSLKMKVLPQNSWV